MAKDIRPTDHLIESMRERNVSWGEIVDVVNNPEVEYVSGPEYGPGRKVLQKGRLAVVVTEDYAVITVLLRQNKKWNNDRAQRRDEDGQEDRTYRRSGVSAHLRGRAPQRSHSYYKKNRKRRNG